MSPVAQALKQVVQKTSSLKPDVKPEVMPMPSAFAISLMRTWMTRLPTETKLFCKMTGMARRSSVFKSVPEKTGAFSPLAMPRIRRNTKKRVRTHAAPCAMKVAHATPATPQGFTITQSRKMFASEEPTRKRKGVLLSPSAEKMPVPRL